MFGTLVLIALIEVYLFSYPLPFLTRIVDVYSSLDNCQIQCQSKFPEFRVSDSCPVYVVCLYLDGFLWFYVFGARHLYALKPHHWHFFSLFVVCPIVLHYKTILLICCFSLFVTWIFWLIATIVLTQSLGGKLDCHTEEKFVYCGQLNALDGFSWLILFVYFFLHCRAAS